MEKIFVDCDIVMDFILMREPYYKSSADIFLLFQNKELKGFISSLSFAHINYFLAKTLPKASAIEALKKLRKIVNASTVDSSVIDLALDSQFSDFEDAIQYYSALSIKADKIITRNIKDFKSSGIPIFNPIDFLKSI